MNWDAKNIFQVLPFYNTFIEKPEIENLSNVELIQELPFYDELSIKNQSDIFNFLHQINSSFSIVCASFIRHYMRNHIIEHNQNFPFSIWIIIINIIISIIHIV